ncbi:MAG: sporulation protein YqfD [Clostridiales bacterium]|nr:sporulation protein YqfD [Clostridiales bacterium]
MFLWLWQVLRGYVMIEADGESIERFLNMAVHKGIYVWDVTHTPEGVAMKVSIKGFRQLRECARKTQCRIRIQRKKGAPFLLHRYRKRKILASGLLLTIAFIYFLASFIWLIDIKGNTRVNRDDLLAFCAQEGLQIGAFKYKIDHKKIKMDIMNHFHDIAWMEIHVKGTRASIEMVETIPKAPVLDQSTPCDIVAAKDGLITSIVTGAGSPRVKRGDVARKGDVLVSGLLSVQGDENTMQKSVHAYAEVWARMYHEIELEAPFQYEEKKYTGKKKTEYALLAFGKEWRLFPSGSAFVNYDRIITRTQLNFGENYPLPLMLAAEKYKEFIPVTSARTPAQARELAQRMLNARIIREFDFAADIVDKSVALQETADSVKLKALITTNERIDQEQPIGGIPE